MSKKHDFIVLVVFLTISLVGIYREVFFNNKIAFPSNLLASFYSPWSTSKFANFPQGIPNKPIGGNDQVRMFYPYRLFINESLKKGELPLWNPYNFSGGPLLADFQSTIFYPLNILYLMIPLTTAWSLLVIIQPFLATIFMYFLLKQYINERLAVFFGAIAYGFSGFIITWSQENAVIGQTALWYPLIILATDRLMVTRSRNYLFLLIFALSFCILAGHIQISFNIFILALIYALFKLRKISHKLKTFILFSFAVLASIFLCAVQIVPSIEAYFESTRGSVSIQSVLETYLLPIKYYITTLAPDIFGNPGAYNFFGKGFYHESIFYIGIIPLVFALYSLRVWQQNSNVRFYFFIVLMTFVLGVKSSFSEWFYRLPLPLVSTFTPSRIFVVASFCLAILAAYGFAYWLRNRNRKETGIIFSIICIMTLLLMLYFTYHFLAVTTDKPSMFEKIHLFLGFKSKLSISEHKVSMRNLILPVFMLWSLVPILLFQKNVKRLEIAVLLLTCLGQFYFFNKYLVVGYKELLYPDHFIFFDIEKYQNITDRFLTFGSPVLGNIGLTKHIFSPDGIDPVFSKRYGELVYAAKNNGQLIKDIPRIEVNLSEYAEIRDIIKNNFRQRLISLLGVTRIYNYKPAYQDYYQNNEISKQIFPASSFIFLWEKEGWQAYENKEALPRVFMVNKYLVEQNSQKIIDLIFDENVDLYKTVILEENPGIEISSGSAKASIKDYQPKLVKIHTETDSNQILFLSDVYYPGWVAKVDNIPVKIYRANYAFRAIIVPPGSHTVTFSFKPKSLLIGALISGSILSLLLCLMVKSKSGRN